MSAISKSSASNSRETIEEMKSLARSVQRTPPEIWLSIFEHAAFVPHIFDTDFADPIEFPDTPIPFDKSAENELKASLVTKLALICVCKSWHDLAIPLLYRAVAARDPQSLLCLRDAIARLTRPSTATRNMRVHRLDLFCWPAVEGRLASAVLVDLLSLLPDLRIACVSLPPEAKQSRVNSRQFTTDELNTLIRALSHPTHLRSLRKCILGLPKVTIEHCNALLAQHTQLSFLYAPYPMIVGLEAQHIPARHPLTCLFIGLKAPLIGEDAQPLSSLRHVYIRLIALAYERGASMEAFLRVQGARLCTVQLDMRQYSSRPSLDHCLHLLSAHCPDLVHLIFIYDPRGTPLTSIFTALPPTVTHLGIYAEHDDPERGLCEYLRGLREFFELGDVGSVPGVIRRLNTSTEEGWAYLRDRNADLHAQCASIPVPPNCRLEDAEGRDLMLLLRNPS
ncbi:hypothetical protein DENSPDRAFT_885305 [Dentipellis sp. KUC8613]|nr:hypothetical protein DENSPDRAFT_885305 [Dentipellis sp. KUC8613]